MCEFESVCHLDVAWKKEQWHSCALRSRWLWKPNPKPSLAGTQSAEIAMLLPPSGDMGQNRTIVQDQLGPINGPQPRSLTNTIYVENQIWIITFNFFTFSIVYGKEKKHKYCIQIYFTIILYIYD